MTAFTISRGNELFDDFDNIVAADVTTDITGFTSVTYRGVDRFDLDGSVTSGDTYITEISLGQTLDLTDSIVIGYTREAFDGNSTRVGLRSGTDNIRLWDFEYGQRFVFTEHVLDTSQSGFTDSGSGTFDIAQVNGLVYRSVSQQTRSSPSFAGIFQVMKAYYYSKTSGITFQGGESGDPLTLDNATSTIINIPATDNTIPAKASIRKNFRTSEPLVLGDANTAEIDLDDSLVLFASTVLDPNSNFELFNNVEKFRLNFEIPTAKTIRNFRAGRDADEAYDINVNNVAHTFENATFSDPTDVDFGGASYTGGLIDDPLGTLTGGDVFTNFNFTNIAEPFEWNGTATFAGQVAFTGTPAHYITVPNTVSDGATLDISNCTFGTPTTNIIECDIGAGKTLNIQVGTTGVIASDVTVTSGSVNIQSPALTLTITAVDEDSNPIAGAAVHLDTADGATNLIDGETDSNGEISVSYTGANPQAVSGWVRSGSGQIPYQQGDIAGTITGDFSATIILRRD